MPAVMPWSKDSPVGTLAYAPGRLLLVRATVWDGRGFIHLTTFRRDGPGWLRGRQELVIPADQATALAALLQRAATGAAAPTAGCPLSAAAPPSPLA